MKISVGGSKTFLGINSLVTDSRERGRFLRFSMVGLVGAVVDFGFFNLFRIAIGLLAFWAQTFSFILAVISNFTWNRVWTYPDSRSKHIGWQLGQFFMVNSIGWAIRTPIFLLLEKPLRGIFTVFPIIPFLSPDFLGHNVALAIAVLVVMLWNFFINRYWTYSDIR